MGRLPLIAEPYDEITASVFMFLDQVGLERSNLYRMLANAPRMLRAYSGLAQALRFEAVTPRSLRELLILRISQLTDSDYMLAHHRYIAAKEGVSIDQMDQLLNWRNRAGFDAGERAALRCAESIHEQRLTEEDMSVLKEEFDESEVVEIVLLCAFYEAVARLIQALAPDLEPRYQSTSKQGEAR